MEKSLLLREKSQQTIRFILLDALRLSEPKLTETLHRLNSKCPTLIHTILPPNDLDKLVDEGEDSLALKSYSNHQYPAVFRCIAPKEASQQHQLPVRLSKADTNHPLKVGIRQAYEKYYGLPYVMSLGSTPLQ